MSIVVVGSSSFVGTSIIAKLKETTFEIVGLQRSSKSNSQEIHVEPWELGQIIPAHILEKAQWIVFCAYDIQSSQKNVDGYHLMLKQLEGKTDTRCLFISTYSAFPDAESDYGRIKFQLEQEFKKRNDYIVRPGLVLGNGSLFLSLFNSIARLPIVPIIGFKNAPITLVNTEDLSEFVKQVVCKRPQQTEFNVFYTEVTNQVNLAREIKRYLQRTFLYIRLPLIFFELVVWLGSFLKIKLPITKENLEGYKKNTTVNRTSDIELLEHYRPKPLRDLLRSMKRP